MLETIYNTDTIEHSAYMLTAYEMWGLIDVKQYEIDEIITPYLDGLDDSDLIGAYNDFADENGYGNVDTYSAYQVRERIMKEDEFLSWVHENYYEDDKKEEREAATLELVKQGY